MKQVVSISLGPAVDDYTFDASFLGESFQIRRLGTDGDVDRARAALETWDGTADAIGLCSAHVPYAIGSRRALAYRDAQVERLVEGIRTPVATGDELRRIASEWTLRHIQFTEGDSYFNNSRVLFLSGAVNYRLARVMAEYTDNLVFADPVVHLGVPRLLTGFDALDRVGRRLPVSGFACPGTAHPGPRAVFDRPNRARLRRAVREAFIVVVPPFHFHRYLEGMTREDLEGKTVITASAYEDRIAFLADRGVDTIIDCAPMVLDRVVEFNVLEAMIGAARDTPGEAVSHDDLLELMSEHQLVPRMIYPGGRPVRTNRFAFVIHPLSQEQLKKNPIIERVSRFAPRWMMNLTEWLAAYMPPYIYSRVSGIETPDGVRTEGWLITMGGTPKQMLSHRPEFTYKKLLKASEIARKKGAQIMGLGAFTKVVGDAGVTVARLADLPITTGNSYSASGALWAAGEAIRRMGLIEMTSGKRMKAKAMVIGATGAIGAACCRLMAYAVEELYMVDIRSSRLLALQESIRKVAPDVRIHVSTHPDKWLPEMDAIVTATSSAGKGVLDIMKVKSGCVITDVARPLDLRPEDVEKRPDVLVIESGEIHVPGTLKMRDIGLPPNVVFACMAETIVLALAGRYEVFTIGRNIEWEKVREIYRLGLEQGMQLAAISGVNGIFTDDDLFRVRDLALQAREQQPADPGAEPVASP